MRENTILDKVMDGRSNNHFDVQEVANSLLKNLDERAREVVASRFSILGEKKKTLESIGEKYKITRERVRQIENSSLQILRDIVKKRGNRSLVEFYDRVLSFVRRKGGAVVTESLTEEFLPEESSPASLMSLMLLFHISPQLKFVKENEQFIAHWQTRDFQADLALSLIDLAKEILQKRNSLTSEKDFLTLIKKSDFYHTHRFVLLDETILNFLSLSPLLKKNKFGDWGLSHWATVKPRGVRDMAYLVLRNFGKPAHFKKITDLINKVAFSRRVAHFQTVHNELIKDRRFVLVGRGIYALAEWGYEPGTVADVIKKFLVERNVPLDKEEIVQEVLKKRIVKRNTILLSLQNKNLFEKTKDDKYQIKKQ